MEFLTRPQLQIVPDMTQRFADLQPVGQTSHGLWLRTTSVGTDGMLMLFGGKKVSKVTDWDVAAMPDDEDYTGVSWVQEDSAGNLYFFLVNIISGARTLFRCAAADDYTDAGTNWSVIASTEGTPPITFAAGVGLMWRCFCDCGNGRLIITNYGDRTDDREIWGSTDYGLNWSLLLSAAGNPQDVGYSGVRHFHGAMFNRHHNGTEWVERLYIMCGDQDHESSILVCTDIDDFLLGDARVNSGVTPGTDCWSHDWKQRWGLLTAADSDTITYNLQAGGTQEYTVVSVTINTAPSANQVRERDRPGLDPDYVLDDNLVRPSDGNMSGVYDEIAEGERPKVPNTQRYRTVDMLFEEHNGVFQTIWGVDGESLISGREGATVWKQNLDLSNKQPSKIGDIYGQGWWISKIDGVPCICNLSNSGWSGYEPNEDGYMMRYLYAINQSRDALYEVFRVGHTGNSGRTILTPVGYSPQAGGLMVYLQSDAVPVWPDMGFALYGDSTHIGPLGRPLLGRGTIVFRLSSPVGMQIEPTNRKVWDWEGNSFGSTDCTESVITDFAVEGIPAPPVEGSIVWKATPTANSACQLRQIPNGIDGMNAEFWPYFAEYGIYPVTMSCYVYLPEDFNAEQRFGIQISGNCLQDAASLFPVAADVLPFKGKWVQIAIVGNIINNDNTLTMRFFPRYNGSGALDSKDPAYITQCHLRAGVWTGLDKSVIQVGLSRVSGPATMFGSATIYG